MSGGPHCLPGSGRPPDSCARHPDPPPTRLSPWALGPAPGLPVLRVPVERGQERGRRAEQTGGQRGSAHGRGQLSTGLRCWQDLGDWKGAVRACGIHQPRAPRGGGRKGVQSVTGHSDLEATAPCARGGVARAHGRGWGRDRGRQSGRKPPAQELASREEAPPSGAAWGRLDGGGTLGCRGSPGRHRPQLGARLWTRETARTQANAAEASGVGYPLGTTATGLAGTDPSCLPGTRRRLTLFFQGTPRVFIGGGGGH